MSMTTPEEQMKLERLARAIEMALPDLAGTVRPLTLLGEGYTSVAVESKGGFVFRVPKTQQAASTAAVETRLLATVGSSLPIAVPLTIKYGEASEACPWGFSCYRRVPGTTMDLTIADGTAGDRIADQFAGFLAAHHGSDVADAKTAGVGDDWRGRYESLHDETRPALLGLLRGPELDAVDAWWKEFFDNPANWDFQPRLVHGDIRPEHLLTDGTGSLTGVIDFGDACIGDPAIDIGGLMAYVGMAFAAQVHAAYRRKRGLANDNLLPRAELLAATTPFFTIAAAVRAPGPGVPSLNEAITELRTGAILRNV